MFRFWAFFEPYLRCFLRYFLGRVLTRCYMVWRLLQVLCAKQNSVGCEKTNKKEQGDET